MALVVGAAWPVAAAGDGGRTLSAVPLLGEIWDWLNQNGAAIGLVVSAVAVFGYLDQRGKLVREQRFRAYHELIRDLVQPGGTGDQMFIDRQIAVAFELRHYREYFDVTRRILRGLLTAWTAPGLERITAEIGLTLTYISRHRGLPRLWSWIARFWSEQ
jgi:hypothetical protein